MVNRKRYMKNKAKETKEIEMRTGPAIIRGTSNSRLPLELFFEVRNFMS